MCAYIYIEREREKKTANTAELPTWRMGDMDQGELTWSLTDSQTGEVVLCPKIQYPKSSAFAHGPIILIWPFGGYTLISYTLIVVNWGSSSQIKAWRNSTCQSICPAGWTVRALKVHMGQQGTEECHTSPECVLVVLTHPKKVTWVGFGWCKMFEVLEITSQMMWNMATRCW